MGSTPDNKARRAVDRSVKHTDAPSIVATNGHGGAQYDPRFRLKAFDKVTLDTSPDYLVKGVIPRTGLAVVWGAKGCGKSFWLFDLLMHVVLGWLYRKHRVQQGPVVYCALEGGHGFQKRMVAWRQHHLAEDHDEVPFYLLDISMDLIADHPKLIDAIGAQLGEQKPAAIVIDTLNRALIGDENNSDDMARFIRATNVIREAFACAIIVIHHCGVQGDRPRGHTSLSGADDAQIEIVRDAADNIISTVEYMKDNESGAKFISRIERIELGPDDDGDPITSCIVVPVDVTINKIRRPVKGVKKLALDILRNAIAEVGEPAPSSNNIPPNARVILVETWRSYAEKATITESDNSETQKRVFARAAHDLKAEKLIGIWGGYAWLL